MSKRAIILAGGKGTRLKPYTVAMPKPLVPIDDMPILEIVIRQLASHGFDHITIAVSHLSELIKAFFGDGSKWNLTIDYSVEEKPLSTMGPLTLIEDLPDNFLIMNGDVLTDLNYGEFFEKHVEENNIFTISSYFRKEVSEYGVLNVNEKHDLVNFFEKPEQEIQVSMGVYAASKEILTFIPDNTFFGFDHLMHTLIKHNRFPKVRSFRGYWLDIGRPDDYERAIEEFQSMKSRFLTNE
ncbi:MAG: sugar phosphate nucleotidyltransferase [Balneolaceae bacterium]